MTHVRNVWSTPGCAPCGNRDRQAINVTGRLICEDTQLAGKSCTCEGKVWENEDNGEEGRPKTGCRRCSGGHTAYEVLLTLQEFSSSNVPSERTPLVKQLGDTSVSGRCRVSGVTVLSQERTPSIGY